LSIDHATPLAVSGFVSLLRDTHTVQLGPLLSIRLLQSIVSPFYRPESKRMSLQDLEKRLLAELECLNFPRRAWVRPAPDHVFDVVIVGAGQSGLAAAFGLLRESVANLVVLDKAPAGKEGVWPNFARMITLRTHKQASGLDFGVPALTPQAWYVAQFGQEAWDKLVKIPKELWHAYLLWYRKVLGLPVRNGVRVVDIQAHGSLLELVIEGGSEERLLARKVILATGLDGCGRWFVPSITAALPPSTYAHTEAAIDFVALKGKRIGVLGGGASAFDNAATALENGAVSVDLCIRLPRLPRVNPNKWIESSGFLGHFNDLDDAARWRFMRQIRSMNQPPPQETLWRCTSHSNFRLRTQSAWLEARVEDGVMRVTTPQEILDFDFLIFGTGAVNDLTARPELKSFVSDIALWGDRFSPALDEEDEALACSPYLGKGFEFIEKHPGQAPLLKNIHNFNFGATTSQGLSASSISGMKYGLRRLIPAVTRDLFVADADWQLQALANYSDPEISSFSPGLPLDEWEARTSPVLPSE
jgi:cation diffusion facilitator CzcD-associated flavoprotein CzcO